MPNLESRQATKRDPSLTLLCVCGFFKGGKYIPFRFQEVQGGYNAPLVGPDPFF